MKDSGLNSRKDRIFEIIVDSYIDTAEPVGSKAIAKRRGIGLSSASIRNVMADLEEEGLLTHPHTSAGRIPTDRGYRYYVDELMEPENLNHDEKKKIYGDLSKARSIDALAERVSKVISQLTDNAAVIYIKNLKRVSFLTELLENAISEFLEEEPGLFIEGVFRMMEQPEFQDVQKMRQLLHVFDEREGLLQILTHDLSAQGVQVHIGEESPLDELENVSLVVKDCYLGGSAIGGVAVVGPTRMRYAKVISVVDFVADSVSDIVKRF